MKTMTELDKELVRLQNEHRELHLQIVQMRERMAQIEHAITSLTAEKRKFREAQEGGKRDAV